MTVPALVNGGVFWPLNGDKNALFELHAAIIKDIPRAIGIVNFWCLIIVWPIAFSGERVFK